LCAAIGSGGEDGERERERETDLWIDLINGPRLAGCCFGGEKRSLWDGWKEEEDEGTRGELLRWPSGRTGRRCRLRWTAAIAWVVLPC
jgi:hypothetical protein